jgi:glutathione S-transferase
MADLIFYTHAWSRGRIARWMLEEVGQPYETVFLDYESSMKAPDYLAVNPMGKVPALKHGEAVVTEVAAICAYLADAFPEAGLAPPPASPERAAYYRWLFFASGPVEAAIIDRALGVAVPDDKKMMVGYGDYDLVVDVLDRHLAGTTYVAGDRFTAADVYLGAQIGWGIQFGTLPKRDSFAAYAARVYDRPAALRARDIDDQAAAAAEAAKPAG